MATIPHTPDMPLPTWRRLPAATVRQLAVLVGRLAWRQLAAERPTMTGLPDEEDADGRDHADRQDQGASP